METQNNSLMPKILVDVTDKRTNKVVKLDVVKIISTCCYINTKDGEELVLLVPNKPQLRLLKMMADDWNAGRPLRYIILKARQMGFSTIIEAFIFVVTMFQPNKKAVIVADCAENASSLFDMSKLYYDKFPKGILPPLKAKNKNILLTATSNSSIRVLCVGDNTGRSKSLQFLHLSEFAFWPNAENTMTSLLRTVSATNKRSAIFIESTANGHNSFKTRWDKAVAGDSPYKPMFFPWYEMDEYRLPYDGHTLSPDELAVKEKYHLDNDQLQWRKYQIQDMDGDINRFHQEYPSCPEEAFLSTGFSTFDNTQVVKRKGEVDLKPRRGFFTYSKEHSKDGNEIKLSNIEWVDDEYGPIRLYLDPLKGFPYVLGGDPANGGSDSYVGQVINNIDQKQVAMYKNERVDNDLYAYQLYCLGRKYNWALIGTEVNQTTTVMEILAKCGYPNLYFRKVEDKVSHMIVDSLGVKTTVITKPVMIDGFKIRFRENPEIINDYTTLCEMETFIVVDTPSSNYSLTTNRAQEGKHDDCVMALAIAYYISEQQDHYVDDSQKPKTVTDWVNEEIEKDIMERKSREWIW